MGFPDYKSDLLDEDFDANYILDKYYHSGTSAVFHGAAPDVEPKLKGRVAEQLYHTFKFRIHPFQLVISGSAHLGFSPVPSVGQTVQCRGKRYRYSCRIRRVIRRMVSRATVWGARSFNPSRCVEKPFLGIS